MTGKREEGGKGGERRKTLTQEIGRRESELTLEKEGDVPHPLLLIVEGAISRTEQSRGTICLIMSHRFVRTIDRMHEMREQESRRLSSIGSTRGSDVDWSRSRVARVKGRGMHG